MRAARPTTACLARDERASSLVEFAVICPVLLVFMMMGIQVIGYIDATKKVDRIAASISEMITQQPPPQGQTTALITTTDYHFSYDASLVIFPYVMSDAPRQNQAWWQDVDIAYAGIQFNKIASNCTDPTDLSACYAAQVMWANTTTSRARPCLPLQLSQANTASTNKFYLPKSVFGPGGLIVIDVYFTYHPTFAAKLLPNLTIVRSAYVQPRYATLIKLNTTNNDTSVAACPGF